MAVAVHVNSAACQDLVQAHDWYEQQSPGLGKEFVRTVDAVLAFIARNPTLLTPVYRDLRRVLTKRFPYAVYYRCPDAQTARVISVNRERVKYLWRFAPSSFQSLFF